MRHAGRKKVKLENQDFLCNEAHMSGSRQERSLFGIFDGHGACGKGIAQHCSWLLPNFADVAVQEAQQVGLAVRSAQKRSWGPCLLYHTCSVHAASHVAQDRAAWEHPRQAKAWETSI